MILIIDNTPKDLADKYENKVLEKSFTWTYNKNTVGTERNYVTHKKENIVPVMTHGIVENGNIISNFWDLTKELLRSVQQSKRIVIEEVSNCRLNLQLQNGRKGFHTGIHIDGWTSMNITALYYVNDSDGDTFFFDNNTKIISKVSPKKGRWVFFNNKQLHAGSCPVHNKQRVVVNWNMLGEY